jgi:hypothetical protein
MSSHHPLVERFRRAGLDLRIANSPLVDANNNAIVQMDIERKGRAERFKLWLGDADTNRVIVQSLDRSLKQLVLFVDEPRRAFTVKMRRGQVLSRPVIAWTPDRKYAYVREFTPGNKRHLLCGMDEQHYFIAQLRSGAGTVAHAHRELFNPSVDTAVRETGNKAIRQGEWFFVEASAAEQSALEALIADDEIWPLRRQAVRDAVYGFRRGRSHIVDELLEVRGSPPGGPLLKPIYVRGKVRHPDHHVVELPRWSRVFGNREASASPGVNWVD